MADHRFPIPKLEYDKFQVVVDMALYAKEALVAACYKFTDRFFVDQQTDGNVVNVDLIFNKMNLKFSYSLILVAILFVSCSNGSSNSEGSSTDDQQYQECSNCNGTGIVSDIFDNYQGSTCPVCYGNGYTRCDMCKGTGIERCPVCNGGRYVERRCYDCSDEGRIKCGDCDDNGRTQRECDMCSGIGHVKKRCQT